MRSEDSREGRVGVEYYWPGTMAGDGHPVTGCAYYDGMTPDEAWDEHERRLLAGLRELEPHQEVVMRAGYVEDLRDLTPLRYVLVAERRQ